jgi:uncharacterized protein (DUF433 family)
LEVAPISVVESYIDSTPEICGGRPRIAGTRITVADMALMRLKMSLSLEEIAGAYDLPLAAVYAAMAYYFDHRAEIDQSTAQDDAFMQNLRQRYPSKVQAKLDEARRRAA